MIEFEEKDYEYEEDYKYISDNRESLLNYDYTIDIKGVTITIPKGFLFYDTTGGLIAESIYVEPISSDFEVVYFMEYQPYETLESLNMFSSMEYGQNIRFKETKLNGLKAYHATYKIGNTQRYEIRFQIEDGGKSKAELVLQVDNDNIKEIKKSYDFKKLLDGIRKSGPNK